MGSTPRTPQEGKQVTALHVSYSERPKALNGHPVIGVRNHPNCCTVMVQRGTADYVVATWWKELGASWSWGHYFHGEDAFKEAQADFTETAARNAGR